MNEIADASDRRVTRADVAWTIDAGRVTITRRKFGAFGTAVLRLFRVRPDMVLRLDPIASTAWRLMDGRSVREVLQGLRQEHPQEGDLGPRLGRFLSQMVGQALARLD